MKSNESKWDSTKDFIKSGGLAFMKEFEKKLDCAGVCKIPLFYTTLSIEIGKPTQDCVNAAVDKLQDSAKPAGVVALLTGLVLLIGMLGGFPLCQGYEELMGGEDDK